MLRHLVAKRDDTHSAPGNALPLPVARPFIVVHWHKDIALSRKEETPSRNRKLPYYSNVTILRNFLGSGSIILRIIMLNYNKRLAENREEELCGTSLLVAFMIYE